MTPEERKARADNLRGRTESMKYPAFVISPEQVMRLREAYLADVGEALAMLAEAEEERQAAEEKAQRYLKQLEEENSETAAGRVNEAWAKTYAEETMKLNGWLSQCSDERNALQKQIEIFRMERKPLDCYYDCVDKHSAEREIAAGIAGAEEAARALVAKVNDRVQVLNEALRPFAEYGKWLLDVGASQSDNDGLETTCVTVGDCRRAAEAVKE